MPAPTRGGPRPPSIPYRQRRLDDAERCEHGGGNANKDNDDDAPGTKMSATMTMRERVGNATVEMSKTAMTTIRVRSRAAAGGFDGSGHHLSLGDEKEGLKKNEGGIVVVSAAPWRWVALIFGEKGPILCVTGGHTKNAIPEPKRGLPKSVWVGMYQYSKSGSPHFGLGFIPIWGPT